MPMLLLSLVWILNGQALINQKHVKHDQIFNILKAMNIFHCIIIESCPVYQVIAIIAFTTLFTCLHSRFLSPPALLLAA